jgi:DNA phosphorothioation-dependent restriction protein DptG
MSNIIEQMFQKIVQLPESDQEAIAAIVLQEIESQQRWDELFARPNSADVLSRMADEALAEARAGRATKLDLNEL